jgi:hypothetical protein
LLQRGNKIHHAYTIASNKCYRGKPFENNISNLVAKKFDQRGSTTNYNYCRHIELSIRKEKIFNNVKIIKENFDLFREHNNSKF